MISFSSYDPEPTQFDEVKIGQWFRCHNRVYLRIQATGNGYCVIDAKGNLFDFDKSAPIDEILVGTYTVTLT